MPLWVGLLQGAAQTLAPPAEGDEAAQAAAMDACEPWSVRIGDCTIHVIYEAAPPLRKEGPA